MKHALGRLEFPVARIPEILAEARMTSLSISVDHSLAAVSLPPHHADPFDRMLIAQARHEGLTIASLDKMFGRYTVTVLDGADG